MRTKTFSLVLGLLLTLSVVPAQAETPATSSSASSSGSLAGGFSGLMRQLTSAAGLTSDNMEYVTTIPVDAPGVSAKIRDHLDTPLLFASGVKGLSIYDISDPASPTWLSSLPLPHSQNEDVQVSEDGTRVVIAADGNLPAPNPITVGLHVIDTSEPDSPDWVAWKDDAPNHTSACADAACDWIYGSSGGIYEVVTREGENGEDDEVTIEERGGWFEAAEQIDGHEALTRSHALNRSVHPDPETGEPVDVLISDSTPRLMMDVNDPENPVVLTSSGEADLDDDGFLQHNSQRPNSQFWTPRDGDTGDGDQRRGGPPAGIPGDRGIGSVPEHAAPRSADDDQGTDAATVEGTQIPAFEVSGNASGQRTAQWGDDWEDDGISGGELRPGELVLGNSESNIVPQCTDSSGGLTTWDASDFDQGEPMRIIDQFRPVNSAPNSPFEHGNPPANALGCSGHWFDIQDGDNLIAASWYEHGVKVIEIQEDYSMEQIGYFQPVGTEAGAAYWVVDRETGEEYIYSMDYARGLDIIRFHRDVEAADQQSMAANYWRGASRVAVDPSYYLYYKRHLHEH